MLEPGNHRGLARAPQTRWGHVSSVSVPMQLGYGYGYGRAYLVIYVRILQCTNLYVCIAVFFWEVDGLYIPETMCSMQANSFGCRL
jgi:hypothetical protein